MKKIKIFVGPHEIAGYYLRLAKGFQGIGIKCDYVVYNDHVFNYGDNEKDPYLIKISKYLNKIEVKYNKFKFFKVVIGLIKEFLQTTWALNAIIKYDVFIFGFGKSLLRSNYDLVLLKFLNKIVISNLGHGSEARPMYIDGSYQNLDGSSYPSEGSMVLGAKNSKKLVKKHEKMCSYLIGAPLSTSYFTSVNFINAFALGIPVEYTDEGVNKNLDDSICRILHSPSHPAAKGSPIIIEAINNLVNKGYAIDFVLIYNKSNSEVISEIKRCDFVIDQIYSDTPLAGFATEAAWFGKPAIVGGYGINSLKNFIPPDMWPPSKLCHPDAIEQAIEALIINKEERLLLGKMASEFVRGKWNAKIVASRYKQIIEGNIPENWWINPNKINYLHGAGQKIDITKNNIRNIIARFGVKSLQLDHRPDIENAFLEFIDMNSASER
jgi:glycosyltransferase involved in cell wall biosynthesis